MIEFGDSRLPKRYWDKCVPGPVNECWFWKGSTKGRVGSQFKYGSFSWEGRVRMLVRVLADVYHPGYDPEKTRPKMSCDNRSCGNPNHLEMRSRLQCKRGHMKAEGELNCKQCRNVTDGELARTRPPRVRRKPDVVSKPNGELSVFGDEPPKEVWRPPGWPKEILGGKYYKR